MEVEEYYHFFITFCNLSICWTFVVSLRLINKRIAQNIYPFNGLNVTFSLLIEPLLALNMMTTYSEFAYLVLCFSNGYFIYDLLLSVLNMSYPGRLEIIVHHILTISSLSVSIVTKRYMGYCMTAMVVELSNIFLHLRQLFQLQGIAQSKTYRINSIITISESNKH